VPKARATVDHIGNDDPAACTLLNVCSTEGVHQAYGPPSSAARTALSENHWSLKGAPVSSCHHSRRLRKGQPRFSPAGMEGTAETDSPLERNGFELGVPRENRHERGGNLMI